MRGRKTGRVYSAPVSLLQVAGKLYLVAPRGRTQWVRNSEATGEIQLKRGSIYSKPPRLHLGEFPETNSRIHLLVIFCDAGKLQAETPVARLAGIPEHACDHRPVNWARFFEGIIENALRRLRHLEKRRHGYGMG